MASSPAWLQAFHLPPAGEELFQSGPARSSTGTTAEELGSSESSCVGPTAQTKAAPRYTTAIPGPQE